MTRLCGQNDLLHDSARILGILFEVVTQSCRHGLIDGRRYLVVAELGLGLSLELRLGHLDRDDSRETLAEVVAVDIELQLGEHARVVGIFFQSTRQSAAETGKVRTALDRIDVVDV